MSKEDKVFSEEEIKEIQEQEDGSVEINYDPNAAAMEGSDEQELHVGLGRAQS